jgi:hypothetical protein
VGLFSFRQGFAASAYLSAAIVFVRWLCRVAGSGSTITNSIITEGAAPSIDSSSSIPDSNRFLILISGLLPSDDVNLQVSYLHVPQRVSGLRPRHDKPLRALATTVGTLKRLISWNIILSIENVEAVKSRYHDRKRTLSNGPTNHPTTMINEELSNHVAWTALCRRLSRSTGHGGLS